MPLERVLKFAQQLAGALAAAHAEDVVHRDLKPQNILVDANDQLYIADFGLAKSYAAGAVGMTQTGAFLGTPRYMSPEQVEGKPTDGRSDLYAFGLILYEMVTGDVPFTGDSTLKVMYQRLQERPKSPKLTILRSRTGSTASLCAALRKTRRIVTKMRTKSWRTCRAAQSVGGFAQWPFAQRFQHTNSAS